MNTQRNLLACLFAATLIFALLCGFRALRPEPIREVTPRTLIGWHLKEIALAFHNYAADHGALPPPALYSKEGQPLLSWRVALLPYLEHEGLYNEFRFGEPWDSPHNVKLLPKMPPVFHDLADDAPPNPTTTTFRVFVGPGTPFDGPRGISLTPKDFPDGTSNTFLVVEAAEAVPWTKPAELAYAPECGLPRLGRRYPGTIYIALADGSALTIASEKLSEAALRAAITRNGGEKWNPWAP